MFNGITHDSYVVTYTARDDVMSRDTYELDDIEPVSAATTFAEMLDRASAALGRDAHLELEREVLHALRCSTCDTTELVDLPVTAVRPGAAICPGCEGERRLDLVHRITEGSDLLDRTPRGVGLPGGDVVAMVRGTARRFLLVDADASPFRGHV
jgi:adenylyltransferase/sulfurtransferase